MLLLCTIGFDDEPCMPFALHFGYEGHRPKKLQYVGT